MSEYFTGITFPQQKVTPSYDAVIRKAMLGDGVLTGCELSYSGSTLTMGAGLMIACGRQFLHTSVKNWAVNGATSGYARLLLTIDTTRASTKETFDQILDSIEYASSVDGFPELQQADINQSGTIYQLPVCVVSLGAGGITGIAPMLPRSSIKAAWLWNLVDNGDFSQFVAQAGIGGSHGTQAYAGDRWILDSGTVSGEANENGNGYKNITLNGTIRQKIANPPAVGTAGVEMISGTAAVTYENGEVTVTSNGGVIGFVKLFEGEYTADNMPKAQPKGYGNELLECQRYLFPIRRYSQYLGTNIVANYMDFVVLTTVPMRIAPSIVGVQNWSIPGQSGMTFHIAACSENNLRVRANKENHGIATIENIYLEANDTVLLSADL